MYHGTRPHPRTNCICTTRGRRASLGKVAREHMMKWLACACDLREGTHGFSDITKLKPQSERKKKYGVIIRKCEAALVNQGGMAVTNRYKTPNLVGGDPEGMSSRLRFICAWGGAPSPMAPRSRGHTLEKFTKVALGPLQPRPTHTPSRHCAPCSLACFHFFFCELPLLSRPRPAQPLLLTADAAGSSVFLSPIGVTIAAARPCMFIECVSAKNASPACARFDACTC
jgi:hypothetical protein